MDELQMRRDASWFDHPDGKSARPLLEFLRAAVKRNLGLDAGRDFQDGGGRYEDQETRRRWRWSQFALPGDFMLAAVDLNRVPEGFRARTVRQDLADRGFAETHLHLKAAIDFPLLWSSLLVVLSRPEAYGEMFASPGAEFDEGKQLGPWLIRCALVRTILAGYLLNDVQQPTELSEYLDREIFPYVRKRLGIGFAAFLSIALREVRRGRIDDSPASFHQLRHIYLALAGRLASDPVAPWCAGSDRQVYEQTFLQAGFKRLAFQGAAPDTLYEDLFWQCQRIRIHFYRHVVQRPMTPGLQWFTRTYARLSRPRKALRIEDFVRSAHRLSGPGLRSLEARAVPESSIGELWKLVREFDEAANELPSVESGIVFHFSRTRGGGFEKGLPQPWGAGGHDQPSSRFAFRYAEYYLGRRHEATALGNLLLKFPKTLCRIRGIDLCTDELGIPLWVLRPLVNWVREAGHKASRILIAHGHSVPPLRTTVHAGEDFVHLVGGVRRVSEAVEFLSLREGDRIGHGVSLGTDAAEWARRSSGLLVTKGERLFDFVWARRMALTHGEAGLHAEVPWLDDRIRSLAQLIFSAEISPNAVERLYLDLYDADRLASIGFPSGPARRQGLDDRAKLLLQWLTDPIVHRRSQDLERVDPKDEVALMTELQHLVRAQVSQRGILVEINPVSNLLIANLGDLGQHPLWRICSPVEHQSDAVKICIGSDDPITFASSLPEEYELLYDAMIESGLTALQAEAWLDRARENGLAARFTVPRLPGQLHEISTLDQVSIRP